MQSTGASNSCGSNDKSPSPERTSLVPQQNTKISQQAIAVVLATAGVTAKGKLIRMVLFQSVGPLGVETQFPRVMTWVFFFVVGCSVVYLLTADTGSWVVMIINLLCFLAQTMNPNLGPTISLAQSFATSKMEKDKIFCLAPSRVPVAGKVHIMVLDKTGTITQGGMDFRGVVDCRTVLRDDSGDVERDRNRSNASSEDRNDDDEDPIEEDRSSFVGEEESEQDSADGNGIDDGSSKHADADRPTREPSSNTSSFTEVLIDDSDWRRQLSTNMMMTLGTCHTVTKLEKDGTLVGNMVEVSMLTASGWKIPDSGKTYLPPDQLKAICPAVTVVRELDFDHHSMTSGCVLEFQPFVTTTNRPSATPFSSSSSARPSRNSTHKKRMVIVKGSVEKLATLVAQDDEQNANKLIQKADAFAARQYYVLAVGIRELKENEDPEKIPGCELEQNIRMTGLLLFRNEIKHDSKYVLELLQNGSIRPIMCTGDAIQTAIAVARDVNLLPPENMSVSSSARSSNSYHESDALLDKRHNTYSICLAEIDESDSSKVIWRDVDTKQIVPRTDPTFQSAELVLTAAAFRALDELDEAAELILRVRVLARMKPDDKVRVR